MSASALQAIAEIAVGPTDTPFPLFCGSTSSPVPTTNLNLTNHVLPGATSRVTYPGMDNLPLWSDLGTVRLPVESLRFKLLMVKLGFYPSNDTAFRLFLRATSATAHRTACTPAGWILIRRGLIWARFTSVHSGFLS
ncbi:hypothetical protein B0H10DRAFT_2114940 [Mycena sp. CBHHK59/15]|nr:hypothetical protein B0H10DRAFT_2114940 [Mycena sp. CBHHK59/15]